MGEESANTGALSTTYLGLMVLVNSLLVSNFILVRTMRTVVDKTASMNLPKREATRDTVFEKIMLGLEWLVFWPFYLLAWCQVRRQKKKEATVKRIKEKQEIESNSTAKKVTDDVRAYLFGYSRKEFWDEKNFLDWKPIPNRMGAITTTVLIVIFTVLFSDKVLNGVFGIDPAGTSKAVCDPSTLAKKMDSFRFRLFEGLNYETAYKQYSSFTPFRAAMQNDTAMYGRSHKCTNPPVDIEEWEEQDSYGTTGGITYFPGQCDAAQDMAMALAREQECTETACSTTSMIDPSTLSVSDLDINIGGCQNCGKIVKEAAWDIVGGFFTGNTQGVSYYLKKMQFEPVTYTGGELEDYKEKLETYCDSIIVACPDFTNSDQLDQSQKDYRQAQLENAVASSYANSTEAQQFEQVATDSYEDLVKMFIFQVEVVSYCYVGYQCLKLYFPDTLEIFRPRYVLIILDFFFGAGKIQFMTIVLLTWWAYRYLNGLGILAAFVDYMRLYAQDPCAADAGYVENMTAAVTALCGLLSEFNANWTSENVTIGNIIRLLGPFDTCCGEDTAYPYVYLKDVMDEIIDPIGAEIGLTQTSQGDGNFVCDHTTCWLPTIDTVFLANFTMCQDKNYVRSEVMNLDNSALSFIDIWVNTGILSSFLIKPALCSYAIALMALADPLYQTGGKYFFPPDQYNFMSISRIAGIRREKDFNLRLGAMGRVFIWGTLLNMMMFNVFSSGRSQMEEEIAGTTFDVAAIENDKKNGMYLMVLSLLPISICYAASVLVYKQLKTMEKIAKTL